MLKQYEQDIGIGGGKGGIRKGFLEGSRGKLTLELLNLHPLTRWDLATCPWGYLCRPWLSYILEKTVCSRSHP